MPSARRRTNSRNAARASSPGVSSKVVYSSIRWQPKRLGQQHFGVQPRAVRAVPLQIVRRPLQQPADGPGFGGGHGKVIGDWMNDRLDD